MIVVLGAGGQLGTAFRATIPDGAFLTRLEVDLLDATSAIRTIARLNPSAVINCAAYTAVDAAEDDEQTATMINGDAVGRLATFTFDEGIPFATYSTDYVFSGDASVPYVESDAPSPIGVYGRSKLIGEELALSNNPNTLVIRTAWVVSSTHDNFISAILRGARSGEVKVVNDQVGTPTLADDLALASFQALNDGLTGVAHLTNRDETSWFGLAREAVRIAGMDPSIVLPCSTDEFPTRARRPSYSVLGTERSDLPSMPSWREGLPHLVAAQMSRME